MFWLVLVDGKKQVVETNSSWEFNNWVDKLSDNGVRVTNLGHISVNVGETPDLSKYLDDSGNDVASRCSDIYYYR